MIQASQSGQRLRRVAGFGYFSWLLTFGLGLLPGRASEPAAVPGAGLFRAAKVWQLELTIPAADLETLRRDPRHDVNGTLREAELGQVAAEIHLKGRTGSFRNLEEKPSFTLTFGRGAAAPRFFGLSKIHLNNSVEDSTYLHEYLGTEAFRAAGIPAPRVAHAMVMLNGKSLGLYVLKEGFTQEFLGLHFSRTEGNLYENELVPGEKSVLQRKSGRGPDDGKDLKKLQAAVQEPDLDKRAALLEQTLDMERFLSFMATELMVSHRDGYCLAANNYRLYHDPASDRLVFLPHGMDQLFGRADLPLDARMGGEVARAVLEMPAAKQRYHEKVRALLPAVLDLEHLHGLVNQRVALLLPKLEPSARHTLEDQSAGLKQAISRRAANLTLQLRQPEPIAPRFAQNIATVTGWHPVDVPAGGALDPVTLPDGRSTYRIFAGPTTAASWRTTVSLEPGRYRFEAMTRCSGVSPLPFGKNQGAGLRVTGAQSSPTERLTGDQAWKMLRAEFEVEKGQGQVQLICELRARVGEAWFEVPSLRLIRIVDR